MLEMPYPERQEKKYPVCVRACVHVHMYVRVSVCWCVCVYGFLFVCFLSWSFPVSLPSHCHIINVMIRMT